MVSETLIRKKNIHYNERKVFEMNINIDKERLQNIGKAGLKIGKHILIEGTIAVTAKGVTQGLRIAVDDGIDGVKRMDVDQFLGIKNNKKAKTFKEVVEVIEDEPVETQSEDGSNDSED